MQLSEKPKKISLIFIAFLESKINFKHLEIWNQPHSFDISEVIDSERLAYLNASKVLFLKTLQQWTC